MSLTHIDCHIFRGELASSDTSSYVVLNPNQSPGSVVVGVASAVRNGLGSQVACKLGLQHFADGVLKYFDQKKEKPTVSMTHEEQLSLGLEPANNVNLDLLEAAFHEANTSVYDFGHRISAGGKLAASMLGVVIIDNLIAVGRVGQGSVYLYRDNKLFPFFEQSGDNNSETAQNGNYIGSNSEVAVQVSSVPIDGSDLVLVISKTLQPSELSSFLEVVPSLMDCEGNIAKRLAVKALPGLVDLPLLMVAKLGPETIYLEEQAA